MKIHGQYLFAGNPGSLRPDKKQCHSIPHDLKVSLDTKGECRLSIGKTGSAGTTALLTEDSPTSQQGPLTDMAAWKSEFRCWTASPGRPRDDVPFENLSWKIPFKNGLLCFLAEKIQIEFSHIKYMTEAVFNHLNYLFFIV